MNYEEASDFEINKAVAEALGYETRDRGKYLDKFLVNFPNSVWFARPNQHHLEHKDFCNNPSDSWPIIIEHKISIEWTGDGIWGAIGCFGSIFSAANSAGINPLRCAMIVFLKEQGVSE